MKFSCERDLLLREITIAHEIINTRNVLSILSNVLLTVTEDGLNIKATDLKVGFETKIPVEMIEPGSCTVFCEKFLSILRSLPDGEFEFEQNNQKINIRPKFKKIDFQLKSVASDKFPEIVETDVSNFFQFSQKVLLEMINQTIFAISDDETRYFMNGVFLEKKGDSLIMVATDGRRLSYISKKIETPLPDLPSVIVPPKILLLFRKLASGEGMFNMAVTEKNVFIEFGSHRISSNLIDGQFPNYSKVIPETQEYTIEVNKQNLEEALKRVSLLVEQKSRRIYLNLAEDHMTLKSEESEIGIATEEIACTYSGPDNMIALNYLYLNDPLKVLDSEEIIIEYTEPNRAITIYPSPKEDYFHIVMPMQLD
jgi:DNA polymerase-3 subunit beta